MGESIGIMYHFVHGHGAVGYGDEADDDAEDVVPVECWYAAIGTGGHVAYMTVLFFSLYRACIWSIVGTLPCRAGFVEWSHRRAGVNVELRVRGIRVKERAHDEHVHELLNWRSDWCRSGVASDIATFIGA